MTTTVTINVQPMTTRPSRQKSPNLYPPGPYTIRLTPLANGVRNDALAPMATASIIGSADTPNSEAVATPIGIMTSAADVWEMGGLTTADTTKIPASTTCGPALPSPLTTRSPIRVAAPVFVMAVAGGIIAPIRMQVFQS